jgi:hypothetical protein
MIDTKPWQREDFVFVYFCDTKFAITLDDLIARKSRNFRVAIES